MTVDDHDKNKSGNVFDFYSAKSRERRSNSGSGGGSGDDNISDEFHYYAFGVSDVEPYEEGREEWIRLHQAFGGRPGPIDMIRYRDIIRVYSPAPELVFLVTDDALFTLEGQYLDVITLHIQDKKLCALYRFDPEYDTLEDEDAPIIHTLLREEAGDIEDAWLAQQENAG